MCMIFQIEIFMNAKNDNATAVSTNAIILNGSDLYNNPDKPVQS